MDGAHEPTTGASPADTFPPSVDPPRVLRRTTDDRMLFGVAAGLGRYLGLDPVVVRIAFVALTIFGGSGILLYLVGLVAIPEEQAGDPVGGASTRSPGNGQGAAVAVGAVLIAVGAFSLVGQLLPGLRDLFGPLLLLCTGALVIAWGSRR